MIRSPEVTIVITTRNRPRFVQRAVASALDQTFRNIEVIVVDDGSAESVRIEHTDDRVRILRRERPGGLCAARNLGIETAQGSWITFLDDDDVLLPSMVETSLRAAAASSLPRPVAVVSGMAVVTPAGQILQTLFPPTLPRGKHGSLEDLPPGKSYRPQNTLVAPLDVMRAIGGWDDRLRGWERDDLYIRLNAVCSIQDHPEVTYWQVNHGAPRLHANLLVMAEGMGHTAKKHRSLFAQHPHRHASFLARTGVLYLRVGRWTPAISAMTRSLLIRPRLKTLAWWAVSLAGPHALSSYLAIRRKKPPRRSRSAPPLARAPEPSTRR